MKGIKRFVAGGSFAWVALAMSWSVLATEGDATVLRIDGELVGEGSIRLVLAELPDVVREYADARRAAAMVVIRQRLAMKSLDQQGGQALAHLIQQDLDRVSSELARRDATIASEAQRKGVTESDYRSHLKWHFAWKRYLNSRMTDQALRQFFEHHRHRYGGREYRVAHIFKKSDAAPQTNPSAEDELVEIRRQIKGAPDSTSEFAALAKEQSEAPTSSNGGDMGWIRNRGALPREVMDEVLDSPPGALIGPVKSPFGYHLIWLHETRDVQFTFDELEDISMLRADFIDALFEELVRRQQSTKVEILDPSLAGANR